jgi:hypothetical protein
MKNILSLVLLAFALAASAAPTPNLTLNPDGTTWSGIGYKAQQAVTTGTIVAKEYGNNAFHKTVLIMTATPMVLNGSAGNVLYGGVGTSTIVPLYTFPKGNIKLLGAEIQSFNTAKLTCSSAGSATFSSISSLGTVTAANDATLTSTEANILDSTANGAAATNIATVHNVALLSSLPFAGMTPAVDGTTTPIPVYFNVVISTDAANAAGTCTFTGTVTLTWTNLSYY